MLLELVLLKQIIVEGAERGCQTTQRPDEPELSGDDFNDHTGLDEL